MPAIAKECSIEQGFNLDRTSQDSVGHLLSLKIGTTTFGADIACKVPGTGAEAKVVGVITTMEWEGGHTKPLVWSAQISTKNKQDISLLVHQDLSNTQADFTFCIYEYDPSAKKWFKTLFSKDGETLQGLVAKEGAELKLAIEDKPTEDVMSPQNYKLDCTIMPIETEQGVHFATKEGAPVGFKWGVSVTA